jgi:ribosome-associated protein
MTSQGGTTVVGLELARKVRELLKAKKGERVALLDVREISSINDYTVIASGAAAPHLKAMVNEVQKSLKDEGVYCYRHSGSPADGWVVLDYVDVVIHIFLNSLRDYYALEELWAEALPVP